MTRKTKTIKAPKALKYRYNIYITSLNKILFEPLTAHLKVKLCEYSHTKDTSALGVHS